MRSRLLPALLLLIASLVPGALAASQRFIETQQFPIGGEGYGIVLADFNGDGKPDMAVTLNSVESVAILLGTGKGFGPAIIYGTGKSPVGIGVADFNRDGKLDLVTANDDVAANAVSILLGNGDGTFQPATGHAAAPGSLHVVVADFNQDGYPDIATSTSRYGQDAVTVLLGRGDGTFSPGPTLAHESEGLAAGDVNGDGKPDLLTNFGKTLHVFLGNGDGTFQKRLAYSTEGIVHGITLGDCNGDGKLDVVTTAHYTGTVSVLLGNGDGTFQRFTAYGTGNYPQPITISDLDGDGRQDLIVGDASEVSVLYGKGDGTFLDQIIYGTNGGVSALAAVDVNGDGKPDIATVGPPFAEANVLINSGSRQFRSRPELLVGAFPSEPITGDFDGNGKDDVVVASELDTDTPSVTSFLNQGGGVLERHTSRFVHYPTTLLVGDFNSDGRLDLLDVILFEDPAYEFLAGNGDGTFQDHPAQPMPVAYAAAAGDFNNDGKPDLVLLKDTTVQLMLGNGDGTFGPPASFDIGPAEDDTLAVADFNGDGNLDLVFTGNGDVSVLRGNGDGTFERWVASHAHQVFTVMRIADLNGDGKPDIAGTATGVVGLLFGKGDGTFQTEVDYTFLSPDTLAVADFNLDGKLDLAVSQPYVGLVSLLLNLGDGTFGAQEDYFDGYRNGGDRDTILGVADFNSDGVPDIARTQTNNYSSTLNFLLSTGRQ
ncbi:MAG: VCBS repeat-containing protein [Acidobacteriales bacterium]|nr:VCBS repeat-containing protein [Terriglobales bacterium]